MSKHRAYPTILSILEAIIWLKSLIAEENLSDLKAISNKIGAPCLLKHEQSPWCVPPGTGWFQAEIFKL